MGVSTLDSKLEGGMGMRRVRAPGLHHLDIINHSVSKEVFLLLIKFNEPGTVSRLLISENSMFVHE